MTIMVHIINQKYVTIQMWKVHHSMKWLLVQQNKIQHYTVSVRNLLQVIWLAVIMRIAPINGFITHVWIWIPKSSRRILGFVLCAPKLWKGNERKEKNKYCVVMCFFKERWTSNSNMLRLVFSSLPLMRWQLSGLIGIDRLKESVYILFIVRHFLLCAIHRNGTKIWKIQQSVWTSNECRNAKRLCEYEQMSTC